MGGWGSDGFCRRCGGDDHETDDGRCRCGEPEFEMERSRALAKEVKALTAEVERLKAELKTAHADTFREAARDLGPLIPDNGAVVKPLMELQNRWLLQADRAERGKG